MAKNDYPGPCPLIWNDLVIDEVQVAQAAYIGASGIVIRSGALKVCAPLFIFLIFSSSSLLLFLLLPAVAVAVGGVAA